MGVVSYSYTSHSLPCHAQCGESSLNALFVELRHLQWTPALQWQWQMWSAKCTDDELEVSQSYKQYAGVVLIEAVCSKASHLECRWRPLAQKYACLPTLMQRNLQIWQPRVRDTATMHSSGGIRRT